MNMKRKIVQHGSSSLTITLPIKWAEKFNLKKGDELNVEENGSMLNISTEQGVAKKKKEVSTSDFGIFTKNNLTHLYQLGYDEVIIRLSNNDSVEDIKNRVAECIGYEIIDLDGKKVYIKSIAHTLETDFDVMLRKAFLITKQMGEEIYAIISQKDFSRLKEIRPMESMNNKFTMACIRVLHTHSYKEPKRIMQIYDIIKLLERICDEYKYICDLLITKPLSKNALNYFKEVLDYYDTFYNLFYKFTKEGKQKIYLDRINLLKKGKEMIEKTKGKESLFLHYLMTEVDKIYDASGEYFAMIL